MASYQPPFAITNHMVKLVSEIAEKIGRLDRYQSLDAKPCLRRNNRIRSIHSSLAIEANSLSIDAVRGVIDGKTVIGPVKEIQEVKNAYRAYDELGKFDPFSIDELKRLLLSVNFRRPSAGIVLDYLNCNSNGRGVQVVSARAAAQRLSRYRQRIGGKIGRGTFLAPWV